MSKAVQTTYTPLVPPKPRKAYWWVGDNIFPKIIQAAIDKLFVDLPVGVRHELAETMSEQIRDAIDKEIMTKLFQKVAQNPKHVSQPHSIIPVSDLFIPEQAQSQCISALRRQIEDSEKTVKELNKTVEQQQKLLEALVKQQDKMKHEFEGIQYFVGQLSDAELKVAICKDDGMPKAVKTLMIEILKDRLKEDEE